MMRPKLLWGAASILVDMHNGKMRSRSLPTVKHDEEEMNRARLAGEGGYTYRKHIELLAEYLVAKRKADAKCTS